MIQVKKNKIRNLDRYFGFLKEGEQIRLVVKSSDVPQDKIVKIGFPTSLANGQKVLPSPLFGSVSSFNALGKEIVRKDLPMETAYRTVEWHWEQWDGPYNTIPMSKLVDVPYKRYPRDFVPPPSNEVEIIQKDNDLFFSSEILTFTPGDKENILHVANLFLEIFGQFEIASHNLSSYYTTKEERLNWQILPPGEYPWEKVEEKLKPLIDSLPKGNRPWAKYRVEKVKEYKPDFHAIGTGGFWGYVVFGFTSKNLYVFECIKYGNATYVFNQDWKELSKLTKAQVIQGDLAKARVIHHKSWVKQIDEILGEKQNG
jgi:hypothetical protein